jgi:hypothetical protein
MIQTWLLSMGGCRHVFIALGVQHEPLDQIDLRNDVDAILVGGGGTFWKPLTSGPHRASGGMVVGLADPTRHPLGVRHGVVSSGVLWNLLE